MIKNKKILITGSKGFIGKNLNDYFKKKNKIYKTIYLDQNILKKNNLPKNKKLNKFDINPDIIFHCAGPSSVSESFKNPKLDFKKNYLTTKYLLKEFINNKKKPLIYIFSAAAVYGKSKRKLKPISPYGKNKLKVEKLCKYYSKKYKFEFIIMRLFSVYGKGLKKQFFWDICNKLINRSFEFYGTGNEQRSWLHINDLIQAIEKLYIKRNKLVTLDIGALKPMKNRYIVNLFIKKNKLKIIPKFNFKTREGDPKNLISNNKKIFTYNWFPKVKIETGINEYVKWFNKYYK